MADSTLVGPPTQDVGLTAGNASGGTGASKNKRNLIIGGIAAVALGGIYLYAKSKSASSTSSSTTSATPEVIEPASNADTAVSGYASSLENQLNANQSSFTNALSSALSSIQASIAGEQSAVVSAVQAIPSTAQNTPAASSLPAVNANEFPNSVAYGSYTSSEFTEIGEDTANGVYSGAEVGGGVPVYASNGFGGLVQGIAPSAAKAGTTFYIPTQFTGYENQ